MERCLTHAVGCRSQGRAEEVRQLAPRLGLTAHNVDVADAAYRAGHMEDLFRAERKSLRDDYR
ncbi:hypothetical protein GCM10009544_02190 [Streptomyces stramineus]|uniref:Uncharacterized protein n=1 Tax=Streptomyces stramineus TaxID=173861 RepID=A0ABN0ZC28_9ACTN